MLGEGEESESVSEGRRGPVWEGKLVIRKKEMSERPGGVWDEGAREITRWREGPD